VAQLKSAASLMMKAGGFKRDWLWIGTDYAKKIADEALVIGLFAGDEHGNFPERDSPEELEARTALARIIRDQMCGFSAELLALAIDPETPSGAMGMTATRRIRFESLRRGRKPTWRRDMRIMERIRQELSRTNKLEAAYQAAILEFGISRSTAQAIWKWHCTALERAHASN
jgi:hypothetical protein